MTTETAVKNEPETVERTRGGPVYRPNVDILEAPNELTLVADMPGVNNESIDIDFEDGLLTVQGKVGQRHENEGHLLLREYGLGDFFRTFRVSERIDVAGIHAECKDGVLTVHLPKVEAAKPRKIAVQSRG
jgi:HSP20 family protein